MKQKFWKNSAMVFIGLPVFITVILGFFVASIILSVKDFYSYWPMLIMGSVFLVSLMILLFCQKDTLSKIVLSNENIEVLWFKKQLLLINWKEITQIKTVYKGKGSKLLAFVASERQINIDLTARIYKSILALCPYQWIKDELERNPEFQWFRRKN